MLISNSKGAIVLWQCFVINRLTVFIACCAKYGKEMSSHHQISSVLWYNVLATFVKRHCLYHQRSTKKCNDRVHLAKDFALVSFLSADFSAFVGICRRGNKGGFFAPPFILKRNPDATLLRGQLLNAHHKSWTSGGTYDCNLFRRFLLKETNEWWAKEKLQNKATLSALHPIIKKNIVSMLIVERAPASFHAEELQERRVLEWE